MVRSSLKVSALCLREGSSLRVGPWGEGGTGREGRRLLISSYTFSGLRATPASSALLLAPPPPPPPIPINDDDDDTGAALSVSFLSLFSLFFMDLDHNHDHIEREEKMKR